MTGQAPATPVRVGFVMHVMQVAGAEVLVMETIRRLGDRLSPVIFCLDAIGQLGETLQQEGVTVIAYGRRPGLDLSVSKRMALDIDRFRLQVLHAHQYTPFFYGAIAARRSHARPRVIFTEHGRHYPDHVSAKRRIANRWFLSRFADRVNAVCDFSARALREKDGFDRCTIEVIRNGIDPERYQSSSDVTVIRARLGLVAGRTYIACVARFHPVKDHPMLIRAFAAVAREAPECDLILVGDGPGRAALEAQVRDLDLTGRVLFWGVREDVPVILQAVDIFALTSVSEAASITLMEAMAAARSVVVTDVGGNPEIVRHGVDGFLVPRGDSAAAAAALLRLVRDPRLASSMGASGKSRILESYRLDDTIESYHRVYAEEAAAVR